MTDRDDPLAALSMAVAAGRVAAVAAAYVLNGHFPPALVEWGLACAIGLSLTRRTVLVWVLVAVDLTTALTFHRVGALPILGPTLPRLVEETALRPSLGNNAAPTASALPSAPVPFSTDPSTSTSGALPAPRFSSRRRHGASLRRSI